MDASVTKSYLVQFYGAADAYVEDDDPATTTLTMIERPAQTGLEGPGGGGGELSPLHRSHGAGDADLPPRN
jgi:hypothetical protein